MAYTRLHLENPGTGQLRQAPLGFSWTGLFFGCFVPLARGDWQWFFFWLLLALITGGVAWPVLAFLYNRIYARKLLNDGFRAASASDEELSDYSTKLGMNVSRA